MNSGRVLVVDDSDISRTLLARTLSRAGFAVLPARDGLEGAELALREQPDAVVTDLEMPAMDGYHLVRLLKSDPASAHIPVVVVTSHGEAPSRYWGLRTGADAYLTKDHEAADLAATVTRLIAVARGRPGGAPPAPADDPPRGPLEVFARLARQFDGALMQSTLSGSLLERGLAAGGFSETNLVALRTLADVVDVSALAIAISEPHAVTVHVLLPQEFSSEGVERLTAALLAAVPAEAGAAVEAVVNGDRDGSPAPPLDDLFLMRLPVRDSIGVAAFLPTQPAQFQALSRPLLERLAGHLALVLDNARLAERLRDLSMLDGLTRVLNHRAIHERLAAELERAQRHRRPLAVVLGDLDHFKVVNDTHGHLAGDTVLRTAAAALRRCLRTADALGRYGGEEFLAVLPEIDLEGARAAAERLRRALADRPITLPSGTEIAVTGSFGAAATAELGGGASASALVSLADHRMYEAKAAGRNTVRP
jgi:two-component system cell cycle response regulator